MSINKDECPICCSWKSEKMVECDECRRWYHFSCAGVDESVEESDWFCYSCTAHKTLFASQRPTVDTTISASETKPTDDARKVEELMRVVELQSKREAELRQELIQLKEQLMLKTTPLTIAAVADKAAHAPAQNQQEKDVTIPARIIQTPAAPVEECAVGDVVRNELAQLAVLMKQAHVEDLPLFSGNAKDWPLFLAVFQRTTQTASIDDVTNVGRLTKALKGEAKELVLDQLLYAQSPTDIIATLEKQYGRKDVVLRTLSSELASFPALTGLRDPNLRRFAVSLKTYVAQLKAMKLEADLSNNFLESLLLEKLAQMPSMYRRWAMKKKANEAENIETFATFIMDEWECLPPAPSSQEKRDRGDNRMRQKTLNVHSTNATQTGCCLHCGGNHLLPECGKFSKLDLDKRWEFVTQERLCFACLLTRDHRSPDCPVLSCCPEPGCGKRHNPLLHGSFPRRTNLNANAREYNRPTAPQAPSVEIHNLNHQAHAGESTVYAKVLPVTLYGPDGKRVDDYAFLDDGSTLTMMDQEIAKELGLTGEEEKLRLRWTKGIIRTEDAIRCDVTISGVSDKKRFTLRDVYCVPNLDLAEVSQDGAELSRRFNHLKRLPLPSFDNIKPRILIGLEHANFLGGRRVVEGKLNEPLASRCRLGWAVYGRYNRSLLEASASEVRRQGFLQAHTKLSHIESKDDQNLHDLVKSFFETESVGVLARRLRSAEDERALKIVNSTLKFVDGRYEVGLLWKEDKIQLPDNSKMALKRLMSEEKKLKKDPETLEWMNQHVRSLVEKGYARKANVVDLNTKWPRTWICPMFIVVNRNKVPPKRRCVADVAATESGVSLNSCLLKGPDNLIALPAALCRARENPIMVTADVAEMFHQIKITQEDQQCQRFLWRDGDPSREPTVFIMQSMMFGPTCSPCEAQHVKNLHAEKYRAEKPEAVEGLTKFTFMDDYHNSHRSVREAVQTTGDAIKICADMGFDLIQVQSNSQEVLKQIGVRHVKQEFVNLSPEEFPNFVSKLLGLFWNPAADCFVFQQRFGDLERRMSVEGYVPTKREVVSVLMKFFDPLGLAAKYIVRGKWLVRNIWREKIEWDEKLPTELSREWLRFLRGFKEIEKVTIPRWYGGSDDALELVTFVDASDKAYAAVSYFRFPNFTPAGVALVMAKTKVAPLKLCSIPRLELEAAKLGARLAETIGKLHSARIQRRYFFSDSRCVLSWIQSTRSDFVPFVAHRVTEILDLTEANEWAYVPTTENVADEATKETSGEEMRWFDGPGFLKLPSGDWPIELQNETHVTGEVRTHQRREPTEDTIDHYLNRVRPRFRGDWDKLVRVAAWARRFLPRRASDTDSRPASLTASELNLAEIDIFSLIQRESFPEVWKALESVERGNVVQTTLGSGGSQMGLTIHPGGMVIRVVTRNQRKDSSFEAKNPILLPRRHELVTTYLRKLHERNLHMGLEGTIAEAREATWIIAVRQALKSAIASCQWCKNRKSLPARPTIGYLHESRTAWSEKPFTFVGVDCFGPISVKEKRSVVKRWGVIFTCLTFRAVHLEVVSDLSADQMLLAIRRLVARRGPLKTMFSDNGTNFVGASRATREERREAQARLGTVAAEKLRLEWRFIPAYSPWMGGAWERLIGYVKKCLKFCFNGETPTESILANALIEAELLTNKRPLTHTPIDVDDEEPLTPNSALFGSADSTQGLPPDSGPEQQFSRFARKRVNHLAQKYARRWEREYLPEIAKKDQAISTARPVVVGDVVLLAEGEIDRDRWKLGRIVHIYPTTDSVPRIVDVKMGSGEMKFKRAVGNLAVLDVGESASF